VLIRSTWLAVPQLHGAAWEMNVLSLFSDEMHKASAWDLRSQAKPLLLTEWNHPWKWNPLNGKIITIIPLVDTTGLLLLLSTLSNYLVLAPA
jgi:hypothetical protein